MNESIDSRDSIESVNMSLTNDDASPLHRLPSDLLRLTFHKYSDGKSLSTLLLVCRKDRVLFSTIRLVLRDRLSLMHDFVHEHCTTNTTTRQSLLPLLETLISRPELQEEKEEDAPSGDPPVADFPLLVRNLSRLSAFLDYLEQSRLDEDSSVGLCVPIWRGRVVLVDTRPCGTRDPFPLEGEIVSPYWHLRLIQDFTASKIQNFRQEVRRTRTVPPLGMLRGTSKMQSMTPEHFTSCGYGMSVFLPPPHRHSNSTSSGSPLSPFLMTRATAKLRLLENMNDDIRETIQAVLDLCKKERGLVCLWTESENCNEDDDENNTFAIETLDFVLPIIELLKAQPASAS